MGEGGTPKAEFLGPIRVSHPTSGFGSEHRDACTQRNWILWQAGPTSLHAACLADVCDTDRGCPSLWALAPIFLMSALRISSACGQFSSVRPALPFSFRWRGPFSAYLLMKRFTCMLDCFFNSVSCTREEAGRLQLAFISKSGIFLGPQHKQGSRILRD